MDDKGMVEALCRYAQSDLIIPADAWATEAKANYALPGLVRRGQYTPPST